jgi:hypothetical protein
MAEQSGTSEFRPSDTAAAPSMTGLVSGIVADAQALMRQELALARVEFKQEMAKTRDAAIWIGVGAGVAAYSVIMLSFALVFFLNWITDGVLHLWGCFAIVGGCGLVAAIILFVFGKHRAEDIHLVPPQTAETLQENVQWHKNPR